MSKMQYSPKLKIAMEEMKAIFKKHDIGGFVVLPTPGHGEFLNQLSPSYSCIVVNGDHVRFKSKLADYGGDKKAWERKTTDSLNLLQTVTELGGHIILPLIELTERLEKDLDASGGPGDISSHTTQNN